MKRLEPPPSSPIVVSILLTLSLLVSVGCASLETGSPPPLPVDRSLGALALPDVHAADAAENILRRGGNAVDATVAAAFALAVTYPEAGNIGGGGFLLAVVGDEEAFLDFREVAPATATRDMYLDADGEIVPDASVVGHLSVAVPGTVAGLWAAHERWGTLPWEDLVDPAVRLARDGFLPPPLLLRSIAKKSETLAGRTSFDATFRDLAGDELFRQPELAGTLERIARDGRDGFYRGETARLLAAEMERGGGLLSLADLEAYAPTWREPLAAPWRGRRLLSAPPPSSGGFAVLQLLGMKNALADLFEGVPHHSAQYVHLVAEIEKRVFADRAEYLGDPDFVDVPIDRLVDPDYVRTRASEVDPDRISPLEGVAPGLESPDTTHLSIVDGAGNAVSMTYTLNTSFGSGVVVEGAGFLLNDEMDDFSAKPGVPNFYGVVGRDANAIEPGKRPLSSMSPTILLRDGEVEMVVGTPGGSTIFTSVFQVMVNVFDFGMSLEEAVGVTRFHHQLLPPDLVTFSPGRPLPDATITGLQERGYRLEEHSWDFGDVQVVQRVEGTLRAASDPRGRGVARVLGTPSRPRSSSPATE